MAGLQTRTGPPDLAGIDAVHGAERARERPRGCSRTAPRSPTRPVPGQHLGPGDREPPAPDVLRQRHSRQCGEQPPEVVLRSHHDPRQVGRLDLPIEVALDVLHGLVQPLQHPGLLPFRSLTLGRNHPVGPTSCARSGRVREAPDGSVRTNTRINLWRRWPTCGCGTHVRTLPPGLRPGGRAAAPCAFAAARAPWAPSQALACFRPSGDADDSAAFDRCRGRCSGSAPAAVDARGSPQPKTRRLSGYLRRTSRAVDTTPKHIDVPSGIAMES